MSRTWSRKAARQVGEARQHSHRPQEEEAAHRNPQSEERLLDNRFIRQVQIRVSNHTAGLRRKLVDELRAHPDAAEANVGLDARLLVLNRVADVEQGCHTSNGVSAAVAERRGSKRPSS